MSHKQFCAGRRRRAAAILAFVVAMLVVASLALWALHFTASSSRASLAHFISTGAFYGAESGLEMALRELNQGSGTDIDSDGNVGTISDNGSPTDDPALLRAKFSVSRVGASPAVYRAAGRPVQTGDFWSGFERRIEAQLE